MGNVTFGIPKELALKIRDAAGLEVFIETGTYKAGSLRWAAAYFERVVSIESYERWYTRAVKICADTGLDNITLMLGDSRTKLPEALATTDAPALLWLDAHWCIGKQESTGTLGECPLKEELRAARDCGIRHYILIDDARLFTNVPPMPHDPDQWPTLDEIWKLLPPNYNVEIVDDVIVALPAEARIDPR